VIVATSSLELGLDVGDLDRVIQIDSPPTVSSFLQRTGRTGRLANTRANCLCLTTTDEGLLRAAASLALWREGFVEPVAAPPKPFHILAQQLMALVLQERGIGQQAWFEWLADVPAFAGMDPARIADLVQHLLTSRILWSDNGILSFAPEGEALFGRKNFLELLSVFSSPPLFKVLSGQKELGFVHESTFYKREEGPPILVLAGRCWKANYLDWKRRIAHVEPTEERGRSRWLGEGQFLSYRVCQSIRRILATDTEEDYWSLRATSQLQELRNDYPFVTLGATSIVRHANGELRWWTFAGGVANTLLAAHLRTNIGADADNLAIRADADNLAIRVRGSVSLDRIEESLRMADPAAMRPDPDADAIENLKFSEALPAVLAAEVFCVRFADSPAISGVLAEPRRAVIA
jgi:ATP-dependent Lhr-like helicase